MVVCYTVIDYCNIYIQKDIFASMIVETLAVKIKTWEQFKFH